VKSPDTVICATTAEPEGPSSGDIQKTAPLSVDRPESAVQESKSMPIFPSRPAASPLVIPTVSQESYAASALAAISAGSTPPVLAPKGAPTW
jgi:hypothetical protein